ncbi:MAG: PSD1 and planctomycete cytochrome C domain-containing protein [Verrucomicrobiota bacterium]
MFFRKIGIICFSVAISAAAESPFPAEQIEFFETSIRPVLAEHCVECHSDQRAEFDLRLDHREGALKGLESGMLEAIRHEGDATPMPHKREKLPGDAIAAFEAWIQMGLPWPEKVAIEPGKDLRDHWSFKPLMPGVVPENAAHPIDHFVHQQLQEKNLEPAPPADQHTLIRRLYFDLVGLPPTFEDQQRLADAPAEEIIDELLESKHYGERWARHWMDVARYSDVRGYEAGGRERRFIYSYTYRDWLIRSLNADMPYDQFVLHQLAAEQIAGEAEKEHWAALGFITLARGGRRHLEIDDQIDTTFRGLMGLTVSCSRCHDHKFDPIPTRDYYSIYGIFNNSVAPGEPPLIREPEDSKEHQEYLDGLANVEKAIEDFRQPILAELRKKHPEIADRVPQLESKFTTEQRNEVRRLRTNVKKYIADSPNAPDRALIVRDRKPAAPSFIFVRGNPSVRGDKVPARFLSAVVGDEAPEFENGSGRLEMAKAIVNVNNPLTARVIVNRVWTWHFGEGLVSTPSDFGHQGETPSHPELLDWLAGWFMENGWSLKKLHRLILTSETWRQSSNHPNADRQLLADPENRLLWRANRQRLDFEQMRDSLLAVSGNLNRELFGRSVRIEREPYPFRRSIYAFVDRQNLPELFKTFDFASPQAHTPKRAYTTIPTQALFTLNHPFMLRQSNLVIAEVGEGNADVRIPSIYKSVFGREPTGSELASGKAFMQAQMADIKTDPVRRNKQTTTAWQYGHGELSSDTNQVTFVPFPKFDGEHRRWQAGAEYPLKNNALSYSSLHQRGGHPGSGPNSAAIARWTAPEDVVVNVSGSLERASDKGDPVRGRIIKNGQQLLKEAVCQPNSSAQTALTEIELKRGDTLDFVVDDFGNSSFDSFSWTPEVRSTRGMKWNYVDDFGGPEKFASPWSIYAQALLATNEFVFVD